MPARQPPPRLFAIVPAAGRSRRMGAAQNKLLLDWNGRTLIEHVVGAWQASRAERVVVVVRAEDRAVRDACAPFAVDLLCPPAAPADMKESIRHGLREIAARDQPAAHDRFLIAPADLPGMTPALIDRVIEASIGRDEIVVPRFGRRRGHPVSLPWRLVPKVFGLSAAEGINRIVATEPVAEIDLPAETEPDDIDTPEDYRRLREESRRPT